ncbi:hypothetical protein G7Y89_g2114 [Cudoniella acicularis]|uniref:ER transporter 6TM N-terminal domain-containing protein n=1 Tax=Cudoniella acicularis TaxID=354080 RepID=A0A8H4RV29_9HELO|nr:hypothetical protein G7Y89_g2114 [Cudoniella acicularis]
MGERKNIYMMLAEWGERRAKAIWDNLQTNHLWQRMLKNTLATTLAVILALIPAVVEVYGKAAYLAPITTVFGHPGRRFGMMAEALILAISGTLLGIGWSLFGVYLSSLVYAENTPAAYTIRGIFLAIALLFHGFLRSHTPRLFIFVLLLVIVSVVSLTSTATAVTKASATQILYPILTASGILILVNTLIFPEFSSSFLGTTTIEALGETVSTLRDAGKYFVSIIKEPKDTEDKAELDGVAPGDGPATSAETSEQSETDNKTSFMDKVAYLFRFHKRTTGDSTPVKEEAPVKVKLKSLTDRKAKLRARLAGCKTAQQECNFELAFAVLPPEDLKPISVTSMKHLVANTIALIGACESKYALMGDETDQEAQSKDKHQRIAEAADLGTQDPSRPGTAENTSEDDSAEEKKDSTPKKNRKSKRNGMKNKFSLEKELEDLELVKPKREIESGDVELLKYLVSRIAKPLTDLQDKIDRSMDVVTSCLAYCYDVPKLPSGAFTPAGIQLQEIDIRVDILTAALADFDRNSATALETAAAIHDLDHLQVDVMPRMETFLISSFLLNLRQAALHTLEMLQHSRVIVEKRQTRHGRRRLYAPKIKWRKWLISGGEQDSFALPESARKDARAATTKDDTENDLSGSSKESLLAQDIESTPAHKSRAQPQNPSKAQQSTQATKQQVKGTRENVSAVHRVRNGLADFIEYMSSSEDVLYALKLTIAVFLVTWPAFLHKWNTWYSLNRGLWAALQLVLITEVAIGTSVMTFVLRAFGTTLGCLWGYAAFQAHNGNRVVCVVFLIIGIIPSTYIQLGSQYVKAGMVSIISMCIVVLATVDNTVPGSATENFLKRFLAFLIGGVVALVVEVALFPVKARDRLVESLASSINQIIEMESCLAYGIETEANLDVHSSEVTERFDLAKGKAQGALSAAETFLPFCANEPRLKGSFKGLALVYAEILYVLHSIVDRMDNMIHLRHEYGSEVLEELNAKVYPYRRNVAASVTLVLFAVHEALTTKLPLPQFLPSARLSHLRMVNRVREVVLERGAGNLQKYHDSSRSEIEISMVKRVIRQKFLSWNAASAGQIEVIEFLEELIDLTKLLVGANEFRSGLLTRPTYREYIDRVPPGSAEVVEKGETTPPENQKEERGELRDAIPKQLSGKQATRSRRRSTFSRKNAGFENNFNSEKENFEKQKQADEDQLPRSLQRVRSRRIEEMGLSKRRISEDPRVRGKGAT